MAHFFRSSLEQPCGLRVWPSEQLRSDYRQLTPGYSLAPVEDCRDAYRFVVLADLNLLPALFEACSVLVSDESFFVFEYYPEQQLTSDPEQPTQPTVFYSPYMPTLEILDLLRPYFSRLLHDGFVGFGLANSRLGAEIFFSEEKAFTCFTANHIRTMNLLARYGLPHRQELLFPADFAHDHLSLVSIPRASRPLELQGFSNRELDYIHYGAELVELFEMSPASEGEDFFLSAREQDSIYELLHDHPDVCWEPEDEFVNILLEWRDFVDCCQECFDGCLEDYLEGLKLRDLIAWVADRVDSRLRYKLLRFIADADNRFRRQLTETGHCLSQAETQPRNQRFWHWGIPRQHGASLRRDLIRCGWYRRRP